MGDKLNKNTNPERKQNTKPHSICKSRNIKSHDTKSHIIESQNIEPLKSISLKKHESILISSTIFDVLRFGVLEPSKYKQPK